MIAYIYVLLAKSGIIHFSLSRFSKAVGKLAALNKKEIVIGLLDQWPDRSNASYQIFRASMYAGLGEPEKAEILYEDLLDMFRIGEVGDFAASYRIEQLRREKRCDEAVDLIKEFDKAKYRKELTASFYFNAAVCFESKGDSKKALDYYKKALGCSDIDIKTSHRVWFNLGTLNCNVLKDYDEAARCYREALGHSTSLSQKSKSTLGIGISDFTGGRRKEGLKMIRSAAMMGNIAAFKVISAIFRNVYIK